MAFLRLVEWTLLGCLVAFGGGCSGTNVEDDGERDAVVDQALMTVGNVRLGSYKLEQTRFLADHEDDFRKRQDGTLTYLALTREPHPTGRHGSFSAKRVVMLESGRLSTRVVKGGFTVTERRGVTSLELFAAKTGERVAKYVVQYVGNAMVLTEKRGAGSLEIFLGFIGEAGEIAPPGKRCTLSMLHDSSVFEEGLSAEEYPDVSFEQEAATRKWSVSIGSWSMSDGDDDVQVRVKTEGAETIATASSPGLTYRVVVHGATGQVRAIEDGHDTLVADLERCR